MFVVIFPHIFILVSFSYVCIVLYEKKQDAWFTWSCLVIPFFPSANIFASWSEETFHVVLTGGILKKKHYITWRKRLQWLLSAIHSWFDSYASCMAFYDTFTKPCFMWHLILNVCGLNPPNSSWWPDFVDVTIHLFLGSENSWATWSLVFWAAVCGQQRLFNVAEAE